MKPRARRLAIQALQRFQREYRDIPDRWVSKRIAANALAVLQREASLDKRCRMKWRALLELRRLGADLPRL